MLESDTKSFLEFFASIKQETQKAATNLQNLEIEKKQARDELN